MECGYCRNEDPKEINSDLFMTTGLYKSGDRFNVFYKTDLWGKIEESFKFYYCPMCGRKLED